MTGTSYSPDVAKIGGSNTVGSSDLIQNIIFLTSFDSTFCELGFSWIGLSCCDVFLSFKCISGEFGSLEEICISFDNLFMFAGFLQSLCKLTISSPLISALTKYQQLILNKKVQNWQAKTGYNELIIRYWRNFL